MSKMSLLYDHVRIDGEVVTVPDMPETLDWKVFQGTNSKSKLTDTVVAMSTTTDTFVYRWSAKHKSWTKVSTDYAKQSMSEFFSYYATVTGLKEIVPIRIPISQHNKKEGETGMNLNKIFGRFGKATKGAFAMSVAGGVAIKRKDGGYACLINGQLTDVDTLALDVDGFYYVPTVPANLAVSDVVVTGTDGSVGFVTEVLPDNGGVKVYDVNSEVVKTVKPAVHVLMRQPFITKVWSLWSVLGENGMMAAMAFGGLGASGGEKPGGMEGMLGSLLMWQAMGAGLNIAGPGVNGGGADPLGNMQGIIKMMCLGQMMNGKLGGEGENGFGSLLMASAFMGGGGNNLFGNLFGGCGCGCKTPADPPAAPVNA